MKNTFLLLLALAGLLSCNNPDYSVLTEAESLSQKGGWLVDPQFEDQMGSPYLLAHGLGNPVQNASGSVTFPAAASYHVWVRTRNWAPGNWEAPGKFKLVIDGKELKTVLGTDEGWAWQYAGKAEIKDSVASVELKDLTGFEGRCDAIYFCTKKKSPPVSADELKVWRKEMLKVTDTPSRIESFDLVITGGGIAGCAAAVAAAKQGLKVALVHDRPVLGGNASGEIRVHTEGITWKSDSILSRINTAHWPNGSPDALQDDQRRTEYMNSFGISIFLNMRAYAANSSSGLITSVDARNTSTGEAMRFTAPIFIDCTGDGWIGYWAGAEYMYGREDSSKYGESWNEHKELWSPASADNRVMGSSVLWRTHDNGSPVPFPEVPWAMEVAGEYQATEGTWKWEFSDNDLNQISDGEAIRDHMFKAIYGSFANAKKKPENANLRLEWTSYLLGKRESRRLVGDYIYTFKDEKEMREFPDAVAMENRDVDVHYQQILKDPAKPDFLSEALYYKVDHYYIPFRSLYSKNITNLMMAGRCFSTSHAGLGGPRVMNTTGQMGVAVGYAASLCKKYNTTPRGIYESHMAELQKLIGLR